MNEDDPNERKEDHPFSGWREFESEDKPLTATPEQEVDRPQRVFFKSILSLQQSRLPRGRN